MLQYSETTGTWWFVLGPLLAIEVYSSLFPSKLNLPAQERPTLEAFRPN